MTEIAANGKPVESVWDHPRPPRLERVPWRIRVLVGGATVVDGPEAIRVLETSQAPAYYVAATHIDLDLLRASSHQTYCEWKGVAAYADIVIEADDDAAAGTESTVAPGRPGPIRPPLRRSPSSPTTGPSTPRRSTSAGSTTSGWPPTMATSTAVGSPPT